MAMIMRLDSRSLANFNSARNDMLRATQQRERTLKMNTADRMTEARDVYKALLEHPTAANLKAARLLLITYPRLAEEVAAMPVPPMPDMRQAIVAQRSGVAPADSGQSLFQTPPKVAAGPKGTTVPRMPSMIEAVKARAKK
jgi:hypothetical protein